ncbi:MAG: hypothetical protein AAFY17_06965 [Cyanobacteria bacterium J06642_11]
MIGAQGELLASAMKQAWSESGTWVEDGESGTWSEDDLQGGLDVRLKSGEPITIDVAVLEHGTTAGQELTSKTRLDVVVKNGVIDGRYLTAGTLATLVLTAFSFYSVYTSGKRIARKSIGDSDLGVRGVMGGADKLLKTMVTVTADESAPSKFTIDFYIQDKDGEEVYFHQFNLNRSSVKSNDAYTQSLKTFFLLEPRESYRLYVEVLPDRSVDRTELVVQEGAHTVLTPDIVHIQR